MEYLTPAVADSVGGFSARRTFSSSADRPLLTARDAAIDRSETDQSSMSGHVEDGRRALVPARGHYC